MMTNLFNSFDPMTLLFSLNWLSMMIAFMMLPMMYWMIPSHWLMTWFFLFNYLHKEMKNLISNKFNGSTLILISLFVFILMNNFMGLFPYIFTCSSHLVMTLSMALPFWLSFMLYGWIMNTNQMLAHLVPQGTPIILMPFMVCIETISNLIRPGTLAIRLMANMIAGHLLMTLLGNTGCKLSMMMINILIITQILLLLLETAVAVIQSYVFTILSTLYSSEVIYANI